MTDKKRVDRTQRFSHTAMTMAMGAALSMMFTSAMAQTQKDEDVERMDEVVVQERAEQPGTTVITEEELRMTPNAQGTVRDALRTKSFIAFDSNARTSDAASAIYSSKISIRGSRPYENHYLINGLTNSNSLKPADWNGGQCFQRQPGGDSQSFMLSDELVSEVDVMSENVSAEYGSFTGGAVNARIRDASMDGYHGKIWVRHSSDHMTQFHGTGADDDFDRWNGGFRVEGPLIKDKLAGMVSFERIRSKHPEVYDSDDNGDALSGNANKTNDNLLVKVNTNPKNDHYASLTFLHAPYEREFQAPNSRNGNFKFVGGGWDLMFNHRSRFGAGVWTNDVAYGFNEINRDTETNVNYLWGKYLADLDNNTMVNSEYASWAKRHVYAFDGAKGDQDINRKTFQWKSAFKFEPLETANITHNIKVGGEIIHERSKAELQGNTLYIADLRYYKDKDGNIKEAESRLDRPNMGLYTPDVKGELADGIIEGEQFLANKTVRLPESRSVNISTLSAFAEDRMQIERVTVRPGVRASWDSHTHNFNVAPRIFANVDVLNDGRFNVNGGYNRYYGTVLQQNELIMNVGASQSFTREMNADGTVGDWVAAGPVNHAKPWRTGDVKTPYSDEFTIGASAEVLDGTLFDITAVKRNYRDQLRSRYYDKKERALEFFNGGKTDYQGVTLSVAKAFELGQYGNHAFEFGVTKSKIEGNMVGFDNDFLSGASSTVVIDGEEVPMQDLPAANFNPEWTLTFTHRAGFFHDRLRTMALMRYESSSDHLFLDPTAGPREVKYVMGSTGTKFNIDLSAQYDLLKLYGSTVTLSVEALNVTNRENIGNSTYLPQWGSSGIGRQFFVGLSAEF